MNNRSAFILTVLLCTAFVSIKAGPLTEAKVNKIINDVRVVDPAKGVHAAALNELIHDQIGLKTGIKSRSELVFQDDTLTRIGPETYFSFKPGTRDMTLEHGTMLLQVPKGIGGAKIHTAAVTASITGTTIMLEHEPGKTIKVLVLEGSLRLAVNGRIGDSLLLTPGKMVIMPENAKRIPDPVTVDLKNIVRTSNLVNMGGKGRPLPSIALIDKEIAQQDSAKAKSNLVDTNLVIVGRGTQVLLADDAMMDTIQQHSDASRLFADARSGHPTPTPIGTPTPTATPIGQVHASPVVITSPDPFLLANNQTTSIKTGGPNPILTVNGTNYNGTTYGGAAEDGSASAFLFGSTSAFDQASNFDTRFGQNDQSTFAPNGVAVFAFTNLLLAQTQTPFNTAGGPLDVAFIGVNSITDTGGSGNLWDANGLRSLTFATENGPITLLHTGVTDSSGSSLKFLQFYARGANGTITLGDKINLPAASLFVDAEAGIITSNPQITVNDAYFSSPQDVTLSGNINANLLNVQSGADVAFSSGGNITLDGAAAAQNSANPGGNGGTLNIGTSAAPIAGTIAMNGNLSAQPGKNGNHATAGGGGGNVNFYANDTITLNGHVKVSDRSGAQQAGSGGNIYVESRKTSGVAINVTSSAQLQSLLAAAAPGPGGSIKFVSAGGDVDVSNGQIEADRGTVSIVNNGQSGVVNLNNAQLNGDVVKVGALGNNGTLNVGGGTINANSVIKLYAGGSNGTVNFTNNVTLSGNSLKTISADTVTIFNGKQVTVNGPTPVDVFTNHANYTGFGGNASTTGTFAGMGAVTQPLSNGSGF